MFPPRWPSTPRLRSHPLAPIHACGLASSQPSTPRPRFHPLALIHACGLAFLLLASLPACTARIGGRAAPDHIITQLRVRTATLEQENQTLRDQLAANAQRDAAVSSSADEDAPHHTPMRHIRFAKLRLDSFTGFADADPTDDNAAPTVVRAYLRTLTDDDRFLPISATAQLRLFRIPLNGDPTLIAQRDVDAADFHAAYRTGLTGTHFTLDLPLPPGFEVANFAPTDSLLLKAAVTAWNTTLAAEKTLPFPNP